MNLPATLYWLELLLSCIVVAGQGAGPEIILQGRFAPGGSNTTAQLPQTFSWAASSVYATISGANSVSILITALPAQGSVTYAINWFRFFVDNEFAADGFTSYNQLNLSVTLNVTASVHNLRIAKMNEGSKGEALLQGISLSPGGRFLDPAPPDSVASGKRMLVFGDSYSVGYGNVGAALPGTCEPKPDQLHQDWNDTCASLNILVSTECASFWQALNENSLQAFPAVAAEALQADYQVIGISGGGMVGYSYASEAYPNLPPAQYEAILPSNQALFNRSLYSDANSSYATESWIPQVVVIASGTNDWHSVPPIYSLDDWLDQATTFLQQISETYQEPTIILMVWPPKQQLAGAQNGTKGINETVQYMQGMPSLYTQYVDGMTQLSSEATRQKIPNIHYLQLDPTGYDNYNAWCDSHPSAYADGVIAEELAAFISAVEPSWGNATTIDLNINEIAIRPNTSLYSTAATVSNLGSVGQG